MIVEIIVSSEISIVICKSVCFLFSVSIRQIYVFQNTLLNL